MVWHCQQELLYGKNGWAAPAKLWALFCADNLRKPLWLLVVWVVCGHGEGGRRSAGSAWLVCGGVLLVWCSGWLVVK